MKVVVINGSPRRDGLVSQMLGHVAGALPEGCEVEMLFVRDMQVRPCTGCMKCRSLGRCVLPEDDAHRAACRKKLDVLLAQQADLSKAIEELIEDIEAGRKYMKTYKQMKMYKDPALNPVLYGQKK